MFKIRLHLLKIPDKNKLFLYDGPDFNSKQYNITGRTSVVFSSFQCSVLFQGFIHSDEIQLSFHKAILKKHRIPNYKNITVQNQLLLQISTSKLINDHKTLSAYKFHVSSTSYINITILSFNFSGPNIGYCKYGAISIYDKQKDKFGRSSLQEVILLCDTTMSFLAFQSIVSHGKMLYLIIYSYNVLDNTHVDVMVKPTACQGVQVKRLVFCLVSFAFVLLLELTLL